MAVTVAWSLSFVVSTCYLPFQQVQKCFFRAIKFIVLFNFFLHRLLASASATSHSLLSVHLVPCSFMFSCRVINIAFHSNFFFNFNFFKSNIFLSQETRGKQATDIVREIRHRVQNIAVGGAPLLRRGKWQHSSTSISDAEADETTALLRYIWWGYKNKLME